MQPGVQRVKVRLRQTARPEQAVPPVRHAPSLASSSRLIDVATGLPTGLIAGPLLDTFFEYIGQFHPSIQRQNLDTWIAAGTMSTFLAFSIAAVSAPFVPAGEISTDASDFFFDKAKSMTVEMLSFPSIDVCEACLLLAWCSFARHEDGLCWVGTLLLRVGCGITPLMSQQYFGMSARMALDLGFHRSGGATKAYGWTPDFGSSRNAISDQRASMCMWTVVMMVSSIVR